jgi:hypothetical protein
MDANAPGPFDLPDRERPDTANRPLRGRNRETWARTATAEVTVIDAGALHEAVAQATGNAVTIRLPADPGVGDTEPGSCDVTPASNAFDALGWLICPTGGMEGPLEAGAFRVLWLDSEVVAESVDRATVTWTVTVKLTDVDELRRLAHFGSSGGSRAWEGLLGRRPDWESAHSAQGVSAKDRLLRCRQLGSRRSARLDCTEEESF